MDTNILKMFILISKKGSISAAAQQLGYAQSNVSTKVHQLESDLNTQLFYRNNRGITLTAAGKQLFTQAVKIVDLTNQTIMDLQHPNNIHGILQIGTLQTAAATFLPLILSQYHQNNPAVELSIQTGTTLVSTQAVLNYKLDGAIVSGVIQDPDLISIPLTQEELALVTPNLRKINVETSSILVFPVGCTYRKTLENWLDTKSLTLHHPLEFNYLNAIVASVSAGLGISILPKRVCQPYVNSGAILSFDLPAQFATMPISFIYRKDHVIGRSFTNFIEVLNKSFS